MAIAAFGELELSACHAGTGRPSRADVAALAEPVQHEHPLVADAWSGRSASPGARRGGLVLGDEPAGVVEQPRLTSLGHGVDQALTRTQFAATRRPR